MLRRGKSVHQSPMVCGLPLVVRVVQNELAGVSHGVHDVGLVQPSLDFSAALVPAVFVFPARVSARTGPAGFGLRVLLIIGYRCRNFYHPVCEFFLQETAWCSLRSLRLRQRDRVGRHGHGYCESLLAPG